MLFVSSKATNFFRWTKMPKYNAKLNKACYPSLEIGWEQALARPSAVNFAENVDRLMSERGIRNAKMASDLGVARATVGRWRLGEAQPQEFPELDRIANYLGTTVSKLFEDPSEPKSSGMDFELAHRVLGEAIKQARKN